MTAPMPPAGPPVGPPPAGTDRTTLWGVLGIIFAFCCLPLGVVFGVLSMNEAKKAGKQPTLAYVAFGLCALVAIGNIIAYFTGNLPNVYGK